MKQYKLDQYEQEIEDALEKGQFKSVKNLDQEIKRHQKIAAYTIKLLK